MSRVVVRWVGVLLAAAPLAAQPLGATRPSGPPGTPAVLAPAEPQAAPPTEAGLADPLVVYLMTMGPGELIHERFGHNAIWIRDTVAGTDRLYNFGMFDLDESSFIWNFVKGRPEYWLDVWSLDGTLRIYTAARRTVEVQELALTVAQKATLATTLARNADPANRTYRYDYYLDNCSTRVRDAIDLVLGGALRRATGGVPAEGSFRFHTQRSISNNPWLYLGILASMGPRVDAARDQWEEMFLPAKVQERLRELTVTLDDGREVPLVTREATVLEFDAWQVEARPPDWSLPLLGIGVLMAAVIATGLLRGAAGVPGRLVAVLWVVAATLGGVLLLFLWLFTNHVMTDRNLNVLFLSPLALACLPAWLGKGPSPRRRWLERGYGVLVLVGLLLALSGLLQHNREIALLTAPPALASALVAMVFSRRRAAAPPVPR